MFLDVEPVESTPAQPSPEAPAAVRCASSFVNIFACRASVSLAGINVGQSLAIGVAHDVTAGDLVRAPGGRETACSFGHDSICAISNSNGRTVASSNQGNFLATVRIRSSDLSTTNGGVDGTLCFIVAARHSYPDSLAHLVLRWPALRRAYEACLSRLDCRPWSQKPCKTLPWT